MASAELKLDPATAALVLIDLQYGIVAMDVQPQPGSEIVARARQLAAAFRRVQAPVVLVTVGNAPDGKDALAPALDTPIPAGRRGPDWSTLVAELDAQPTDLRVMKRQWGAFYGTDLDLQLRRRGIRSLVLAGISTNIGVESTARDAFERGYDQVFVTDAMGSPSAEAHANTLKYTFPRIGRLRTTDEVIAALPT
ncbi:hydrolase [Cupriavidus consociatus]|uniref:hydrolase n=1 Tax=Cupriavidus consociatus TaxID=2821357 RepID=UPI001AE8C1D1|nr:MULTISPECIES: hydrolase [unclassified Cupriavidus]MBP0619481.1 hydrolase [Cupriavidus sp. LEh25]MDK2656129.1 hydrolase [Cupriavidus sp. LEh21]